MKNRFTTLFVFSLFLLSCPSDDMEEEECTKTIIVQHETTIYGQYGTTYIPEITQEVSCDFPEPEDPKPISEGDVLENFSYEVLIFVFTPDTGSNTSRLQFQIKLNNNNDFDVNGNPVLTINGDNVQFSHSYTAEASSPCNNINANDSCILELDKEYPLDPNLGTPSKFELVSVKYVL